MNLLDNVVVFLKFLLIDNGVKFNVFITNPLFSWNW